MRRLDRRITFERRTRTVEDVFGTTEGEAWAAVCEVFASVLPVLPRQAERLGESYATAEKLFDIEVRWGAPIDGQMRVRFGDETLQIVSGPTDKGRQDRLVLIAKTISTEGVQP